MIVLCHGVFDLLHLGHVAHLKVAREFGDRLYVSVVADKYVKRSRPLIYNQAERIAMLSSLRYVDKAVLCDAPGPEVLISSIRPDVYVRGADYIGKQTPEEKILKKLRIPIKYTATMRLGTTELIEKIRNMNVAAPQ